VPSAINKTVSLHFKNLLCHTTNPLHERHALCPPDELAPYLNFERAWSDFTGAEYMFLVSGAFWCDFERWSWGTEHLCERGAEILTAQLRSHALAQIHLVRDIGFMKIA